MTARVRRAIEAFARRRMARGELLTWKYDDEAGVTTFYVPDDIEVVAFPTRIAGVPTKIKRLPRPIPLTTSTAGR